LHSSQLLCLGKEHAQIALDEYNYKFKLLLGELFAGLMTSVALLDYLCSQFLNVKLLHFLLYFGLNFDA